MKRCPACNRAYQDESLRFCLDDGTSLVADLPATIAAPTAILPSPEITPPTLTQTFRLEHQVVPLNYQPAAIPQDSRSQKRSPLIWVVMAIMAVLIVVLGIGILVMMSANKSTTVQSGRLTSDNPSPDSTNSRSSNDRQSREQATDAATTNVSPKATNSKVSEAWQKALGKWKTEEGTLVVELVESGPGIEGHVIQPSSKWPKEIQPGAINFRSTGSPQSKTIVGTCMQLPQPGDCPSLVNLIRYDPCNLTLDEAEDKITFRQRHRLYNARTCEWTNHMAEEDVRTWIRMN